MLKALLTVQFNFVAFNVFWLSLVLGRESLLWIVAPVLFAYVFLLVYSNTVNIWRLLIPAALGFSIDLIVIATGIVQFTSPFLVPLWLPCLWLAFSTALALSLRFIAASRPFSAIGGALGFPFAFWAGMQLGAVSFTQPLWFSLVFLAVIWANGLPIINGITNHYLALRNETA